MDGVVQGVGFRPFVYRLANLLGLKGYIFNSTQGVVIEIQGETSLIKRFLHSLKRDAPPISLVTGEKIETLPEKKFRKFEIRESRKEREKNILISPDIATCNKCLQELFNAQDRRFHYPFINCTDCGPRFTIIHDLPYDRPRTTMRKFKMCVDCQREYEDPMTRRYHAQPNACPKCGPAITLISSANPSEFKYRGERAVSRAVTLLKRGYILAAKGIGGYHLICDAQNSESVKKLRERKKRPFKPFAIMSLDADRISQYCYVSKDEKRLLENPRRPIVLLRKRDNNSISKFVAPNNNYLGTMLPYAPIHYLLLSSCSTLAIVATSANLVDQPLIINDKEAIQKLSEIADYFLIHNRDIYNRCDDSIIQVMDGNPVLLRRARGYVPLPIRLRFHLRWKNDKIQMLGCGAELKNTFCLVKSEHAFMSQHIGDLKNLETFEFYREQIESFKDLFGIKPRIVVYDIHPDYLSTKYAFEQKNCRMFGAQHHHSHIASAMAENGLNKKVIGVAFDGIGYGLDGNIWGGEFFIADYNDFKRVGQLNYIPMPGGDKATQEPYRMAISYLYHAFGQAIRKLKIDFIRRIKPENLNLILNMINENINCPLCSSMGRFFDAVSSILGICDISTYEGQAAVELQMKAEKAEVAPRFYRGCSYNGFRAQGYKYKITEKNVVWIIETDWVIQNIVKDLQKKIPANVIADKFHRTISCIVLDTCSRVKNKSGINDIVLSGGVFQNKLLTEMTLKLLRENYFSVYTHHEIPPNDGGISLGQAAIGISMMESRA